MKPSTAVIIGGGIAGCSTAYALASRGIKVTILERNGIIASEASGNPQAMLYPRLSGDDEASQFALISYLYSLNFYKSLNLDPADINICGMLQLGFNPRELARIENVAEQNHANNILIEKADIVIIANANEAKNLGFNLYLKTQAVRGQVSIVEATNESNQLQSIICSDGYLSPVSNNQHCLGATFSVDNMDDALDDEDHQANLFRLKSISLPIYESLKDKVTNGRVSFRCTSFDYYPLVGELLNNDLLSAKLPRPNVKPESLPWIKGLFINVAHGSRGFTSAPFCAELLAQIICKESLTTNLKLTTQLNPNRFILRKLGLKRLAKMPMNQSL